MGLLTVWALVMAWHAPSRGRASQGYSAEQVLGAQAFAVASGRKGLPIPTAVAVVSMG